MHLKKIIPFLIGIFMLPVVLKAQVTTSSMSGVIRDDEGKALAGATVTALYTPSNIRYNTTSSPSGRFSISNMRSGGPYTITVSYVGTNTETYNDVYLTLAENFPLDPKLVKTSSTLQAVTVAATGRNTILNSNRNGAATNIGRAEIQRLPSITRSLNDITRITPQSNGSSVGGGNYRQNNVTVDGADFNNNFGIGTNLPAGGSPISLDALDQITVSLTPFDVRQSGFIGSSLNAVTRSGTNQFSGSVYRYWRSEKQQGDKVGKTTITRAPFDFEQYGARIGGPIIKNKLFFFASYETENQPKIIQPRVASRPGALFGSSSNIVRPTADSLTIISDYLRTTYGYETGPFENYTTNIERTKILGRIDWNINSRHRFNVRYNQVEGGEPNPPSSSRSPLTGYATGAGRTDINALWYKNSNYFQGANFYSVAAELNSRFGSRFTNTLRATFTDQDDSRSSESAIFPFVDILSGGTPYTSFGYEPFTLGNLRKVKSYSFIDNFTYSLNRHLFTVGAQAEFSKTTNGFQRFATSYYTFPSWNAFISGQKPTDFAITYSTSPGFAQAFPGFKFAQYSAYIQDDISINDRFKLSAGLRVDLPTYPDVDEIKTHPLILPLVFENGEHINTGNLPKKSALFSPRVGFNWDVNGDRSLQVRGGAGIFTGKTPFVWIVSQSGDAGLLQVTQTFVGQANTPGPFNPNPAAYLPATPPPAGTVIPSTISALAEDFKFPQSFKSSLAFDKRIAKNLIFTLEGVFNRDLITTVFRNPNLNDASPLNVTGYPDSRLIYPSANAQKFRNPLNAAGLPTPNGTAAFNTIVMGNGYKGYYLSLTAKLEKQFSKGFSGLIAYTNSTASNLFDGNGDQPLSAWQGTATVNGSNHPVLGNASFVVPNRIIAAVSYRKEYLKHLGTTISLFYEGSAQQRFSYTYTADFNRDGTNFDLIYIPRDPSEITFVSKTITTNGVSTVYTPQQQSDAFFAYIDQDKYLRKHKGEYAERNAGLYPFRHQIDMKVLQDIFTNIGKKRNTIQASIDIFNLGNLIDADWGTFKTANASSILVPTNVAALVPNGSVKPTFQLATDRNALPTSTFRTNESVTSTYYMQFGIRYIFN